MKSIYLNVVFVGWPFLYAVHGVASISVFNIFMKNIITVPITIHNFNCV